MDIVKYNGLNTMPCSIVPDLALFPRDSQEPWSATPQHCEASIPVLTLTVKPWECDQASICLPVKWEQ